MELKMRNFKTSDVFAMSRILKKMDLQIQAKEGQTQQELGIELVKQVIENLGSAEKEVNDFLASLLGMKTKEFEELDFEQVFEVMKLFKEHEGVQRFLQLLTK